ncbi:hypothetical protein BC938DRAFT_479838 [Jimgerdemannia flammicorona]|uniref:Aminoglycoside phosphotransferase domain-containing protein n=1 Tax=Jimgerdemannia flammicorona TaxID=994334 RepID=A0A433QK04_9FUNG|nr:hypothetical protein BC938DRAFT_479838 [Jimgerdemannia flammicorona]
MPMESETSTAPGSRYRPRALPPHLPQDRQPLLDGGRRLHYRLACLLAGIPGRRRRAPRDLPPHPPGRHDSHANVGPHSPVIRNTFEHLARLALAFDPKDLALERCSLKHTDIRLRNFLVDCARITGLIDWECAGMYPAWSCAKYPIWINDYDETAAKGEKKARLRAFFRAEVAARASIFEGDGRG